MTSPIADPALAALLDELHLQSQGQEAETAAYFQRRIAEGTLSWEGLDAESHRHFADKLVALDRDKAEFCHLVCRALRARRIVEVGTSFGVSTLYLADAVRANLAGGGGEGVVIGTEHEPSKAKAASANFAKAGLAHLIDLRVGDLRETLKNLTGPIDFVLVDIWVEVARPALELIAPHLRAGSVIVTDNTAGFRKPYEAYFAFLADPPGRFATQTLPFAGGLEMTVRL